MAEERTHTDSGTGTPIAENEQVKALLALLKENDSPAYVDFAKLIESVTGMENRLSIASASWRPCGRTCRKCKTAP